VGSRGTAVRARHEAVTLREWSSDVQNRVSVHGVQARRPVGWTRPRATASSDRPASPPAPPPKRLRIGHRRHRQAPARRARRAAVGRSAGVGRGRQHRRRPSAVLPRAVEGPGQEAAVLAAATLAGPGDLDRWAGAAGAIMGGGGRTAAARAAPSRARAAAQLCAIWDGRGALAPRRTRPIARGCRPPRAIALPARVIVA